MKLEQKLAQIFGYSSFRPGQREIIESVLAGYDTVALLPTGTGKSLCYQLPGYVLNGSVLIISPLLSLMQDQVDQLKRLGEKRAIALNSFLSPDEKRVALTSLAQYRFIFMSPEMLTQPNVQQQLGQVRLALIVIDEAHCISQWGFDFRPDYLRIHELFTEQRPPILALTATATEEVLTDIEHSLYMKHPNRFIHSVDRPNIKLIHELMQSREDKQEWLERHVTTTAGPGIIYMASRRRCDEMSERLLQKGVRIASYHGGKEQEDRQFIQQQFIQGQLEWIVATNAFGMGVHKDNIRQVIHETMPKNLSDYMQEIGRAGRDGKESVAILLYAEGDEQLAKYVAQEDLPSEHHIELYRSYVQQGVSPAQMKERAEISDTAYRVLDYWLCREDAEVVKRRFASFRQKKLSEVDHLLQIIQSTNCIRAQIVHYFGQTVQPQEVCCSHCHLTFDHLLKPREVAQSMSTHWRDRLKMLLI